MASRRPTLVHLESLLYGVPLAVSRQRFDAIEAYLQSRVDGDGGIALEAATPGATDDDAGPTIGPDGVGVFPVMGTFVKRAGMMSALSGVQSYAALAKAFEAFAENPAVRGIVAPHDTPGGQVAGMFEWNAVLRKYRGKKPMWAIADEVAASAGYLSASAFDRVLIPATGLAGSIGIIGGRRIAAPKDGEPRTVFVVSGAHKLDGNPELEPTDDEMARLQARVRQLGRLFFEAVAVNRGMTAEAVEALEAGTFIGADAKRVGLADDVMPMADAVAAMREHLNGNNRRFSTPSASAAQSHAAPPQRRGVGAMDENVIALADHQKAVDAARAEAVAQAKKDHAEYASLVGDLCAIAGDPGKAAEFIAAGASIEGVRTWAKELRAKALQPGANVNGTQPAAVPTKPKGFKLTSAELNAKRAKELDEDRRNNPLIARVYGATVA